MVRSLGLAITAGVVLGMSGCRDGGERGRGGASDPMAPEQEDTEAAAFAVVVLEHVDDVVVEDDRLILPRTTHADVLERAPGDVLVGDRQSPGASRGKNPHGFLRRILEIDDAGDDIVVRTEIAALEEILPPGHYHTVLQMSEARPSGARPEDPGPAPDPGDPAPPGVGAQTDDALPLLPAPHPVAFTLLDYSGTQLGPLEATRGLSFTAAGVPYEGELYLRGSITLDRLTLDFVPGFDIDANIDGPDVHVKKKFWNSSVEAPHLKSFHAIATGHLQSEVRATATIEAGLNAELDQASLWGTASDEERQVVADALGQLAAEQPLPVAQRSLFSGGYDLPTWAIAGIPVVSSVNYSLDLSCSIAGQGNASATVGTTLSADLEIGARYSEDEGWTGVDAHPWSLGSPEVTVTSGLTASLSCTLTPRIELFFYGVAGPNIYVAAGPDVGIAAAQTCPGVNGVPHVDVTGTLAAHGAAGVGARLGLTIKKLHVDETLADKELELYSESWPVGDYTLWSGFPSIGLGWCSDNIVECGDGMCSAGETCAGCEDDCGACPAGCGDGRCGAGEDCDVCPMDRGACPEPCANATQGTGWYCGGGIDGDPDRRYLCNTGVTVDSESCAHGCASCPDATNDMCRTYDGQSDAIACGIQDAGCNYDAADDGCGSALLWCWQGDCISCSEGFSNCDGTAGCECDGYCGPSGACCDGITCSAQCPFC